MAEGEEKCLQTLRSGIDQGGRYDVVYHNNVHDCDVARFRWGASRRGDAEAWEAAEEAKRKGLYRSCPLVHAPKDPSDYE
jgi:hypothetical protein